MKNVRKHIALFLLPAFLNMPFYVNGAVHCGEKADSCCCPEKVEKVEKSCCDTNAQDELECETTPALNDVHFCGCVFNTASEIKGSETSYNKISEKKDILSLGNKIAFSFDRKIPDKCSVISKSSFVNYPPKIFILNSSLLN